PVISAIINTDNTGTLSIDAREETFRGESHAELRSLLMARVIEEAGRRGRPVRVSTMDESGLTSLVVSPEGEVEEEESAPDGAVERPSMATTQAPRTPVGNPAGTTFTAVQTPPTGRRALREAESFLTTQAAVQPATRGFRGWMASMGFRMAPSAEELAERAHIDAVSRHWPGTRTVMIANRKGGANKTPTVKNLAATFARYGGGGVLAYDGNPEVGTLGWRTEQGGHTATVLDVLDNSANLLSTDAVSGHMSRYVHHQPADKFDVLRSDDSLVGTHVMTGDDVDLIHRVAAKYYRLIVMDSGNVDRGSDWARMIHHTNQLVVPTTTMEDRAEAALLTLRALQERDEHAAKLAENAVVIVSQWQPGEAAIAERIAEGFRPYVREVVTVPYDPALKSGRIVHDALTPTTRRAWLRATAAVAQGL
ncbi:chromosome partitioning protein ParA, partial [Arthrobacter sp. Soc17.1.1.1]|uniref:MinD/ParA family ATP-binding protein n=1 Tax=Arthrobacter sp. Soc17.1.1.1 TaxID=3121277 RepID=UPI002FE4F98A